MKHIWLFIISVAVLHSFAFSSNLIPASDPNIQYYGRWDFSNSSAPTHSWPGVYIVAAFEGTSVGISTNDNFSYYNVFIDDTIFIDFHGTNSSVASYSLKTGLQDTVHTILITLRNETNWTKFSFNGFILDSGKKLLPPPVRDSKGIEFIGDSYTCAAGNLWTNNTAAPGGDWTDLYEGFPSMVARHYGAQYTVTAHSGWGLVHDYNYPAPNYSNNLPSIFGSMVSYATSPAWNFSGWQPSLVVICLGLNDYSGWGGYNTNSVSAANTTLFKESYHSFIGTIMDHYPHAKILAVASNGIAWLQNTISQVVSEEKTMGHTNVFYSYFPYYDGGYVNNGHPSAATHQKIADTLIASIDVIDAWTPFNETTPPAIVNYPDSLFVVTEPAYTLTVRTAEYDTVRYSTADKPYDEMENQFAVTGTRVHSTVLNCQDGELYTYYLRARNAYGIESALSAVIQFRVDTTKALLTWNSSASYSLSDWKLGKAPLGNDNAPGDTTTLSPSRTVYFRQTVNLTDISAIDDFRVFVKGHDGAVAYVNGKEIGRLNIDPAAYVLYNTAALGTSSLAASIVMSSQDRSVYLKNGKNVIAVEVHSKDTTSPSISFDAQVADNYGLTYINLGQEWFYYDKGSVPPDQVVDKSTLLVAGREGVLPEKSLLMPNYPNPFNPVTKIGYQLATAGHVTLKVYDILGREAAVLVDEFKTPGLYDVQFDASRYASGVYFYRLETGSYGSVRKMMLLK